MSEPAKAPSSARVVSRPRRSRRESPEGAAISIDDAAKRNLKLHLVAASGETITASGSSDLLTVSARTFKRKAPTAAPKAGPRDQVAQAVLDLLADVGIPAEEGPRLIDHVRDLLRSTTSSQSTPVSQADVDYLRQHAGLDDPSVIDDWNPQSEDQLRAEVAVANATTFMMGTLSREEAAQLLDRDESVVSRRVSNGQLLAVYRDGRPRFPRWQFHNGQALPGLPAVIDALSTLEMNTVAVSSFMVRPNDELDGLPPVDYLVGGGDPEAVVALLESMARS